MLIRSRSERFKVEDKPNSPIRQTSVKLNNDIEINPYLPNLVVWPWTIASCLEGIDAGQQLWFKSELARLGTMTGAGVLECAETDRWAIL